MGQAACYNGGNSGGRARELTWPNLAAALESGDQMKVQIEGNTLTVETTLDMTKPSRSGNSTIIATTRGQQFIGMYNGRPTYLQLNVMQMDSGAVGTGFEVIEKKGPQRAPKAA